MNKYQSMVLMMLLSHQDEHFNVEIYEDFIYIYFGSHKSINIPQNTSYWDQFRNWHLKNYKQSIFVERQDLIEIFDLQDKINAVQNNSKMSPIEQAVCNSRGCYRSYYCSKARNYSALKDFGVDVESLCINIQDCQNNHFNQFDAYDRIEDVDFFWKTVNKYAIDAVSLAHTHIKGYAFQLEEDVLNLKEQVKKLELEKVQLESQLFNLTSGKNNTNFSVLNADLD